MVAGDSGSHQISWHPTELHMASSHKRIGFITKKGARRREPKTFFKAFPDFLFSFSTIKKKKTHCYYILTYRENISRAINDIAFLAVDWEYAVRKTQKLQS